MKLVIVESPTKEKTIGKYLGRGFRVVASKGHVCDLAKTGKYNLGVDIDSGYFEPTYDIIPTKINTVNYLSRLASEAEEVYLATDPDREGEAISWHLARVLNLDVPSTKRLEFNEITPYAIKNAIDNPRFLDMDVVASQETRRILDRIIGFRLSYLLQKKIHSRSGGRVQSAVLNLIYQREDEIEKFEPKDYYEIFANIINNSGKKLAAKLCRYRGKKIDIDTPTDCDYIIAKTGPTLEVTSVEAVQKPVYPKPPLTTSSLQQDAFSLFGYSGKRTMKIAQGLYEGKEIGKARIGLITYMRTDSIRMNPMFISTAAKYIKESFGDDYVGRAYHQKEDSKIQDAHEAIRPTDVSRTPEMLKEYLTSEEYNIYQLIFIRAIASVMKAKEMLVESAVLISNDYEFEVKTTKTLFDGFTKLSSSIDKKVKEEEYIPLSLNQNDVVNVKSYSTKKLTTKAPNHFTEGQLVKKMEETGIGRPSTYATTIELLRTRGYISQRGSITLTEQGKLTAKTLLEYFSKTVDVQYTAEMEERLDKISNGNVDKLSILRELNGNFENEFHVALNLITDTGTIETGEVCPNCGKPLVERHGKFGDFVGCSGYPECNYIKPKESVVPSNAKVCPKCHEGHLVIRHGKKSNFLACNRYPNCDYTEKLNYRKKK